jgi:hypothetical protein
MGRPTLEVADLFRAHGPAYRARHGATLSAQQHRAMHAIESCRTPALGGHVDECDACGHRVISYNSCRNRHCPKCQGLAKAQWLEARRAELLPVEYFHVVFTLPELLAPLALQNPRVVYGLLFQAVARTLLTLAADPKHLGAELGFLAILHTWGQNLLHHPHIHCVIPGGGLAPEGDRWVSTRPGFFLPVRVLSHLYRRLFLEALDTAFRRGRLTFHGALEPLADPGAFHPLIESCRTLEWVVYAKPPFGGPDTVLDYLGRYTHRIAISNHRLLDLEGGRVTFTWKNYRDGGRKQTMTLEAEEFIRRFLLHVLPEGFVRIRYYGFLANAHRAAKLALCRQALRVSPEANATPPEPSHWTERLLALTGLDPLRCPHCGRGHLVRIETLKPSPPFHPKVLPKAHAP